MPSYFEITFHGLDHDNALAASAHRCIARLAATGVEVRRAAAAIEAQRRRTNVMLSLVLGDGQLAVATTSHPDPYVAVAEAFRVALAA